MGNLQYRATVWICRRLSNDACSDELCNPLDLFHEMLYDYPLSWGRYAVYMTWLNHHFNPAFGMAVFDHLKQHHPETMYSFWYLAGQYYGNKMVRLIR